MDKRIKKENKRGNLFTRTGSSVKNWFSNNIKEAKETTLKLFIALLFCTISGIGAYFLVTPAQEIRVANTQMITEINKINEFAKDSEERKAQEAKASEAITMYTTVRDTYQNDDNGIIKAYAQVENDFLKGLIAFVMAIPFISIVVLLFKDVKKFVFAVINLLIVIPMTAVIKVIVAIVSEIVAIHKEKKASKKQIAKHSEPRKIAVEYVEG
jgi:hypothetical protein